MRLTQFYLQCLNLKSKYLHTVKVNLKSVSDKLKPFYIAANNLINIHVL